MASGETVKDTVGTTGKVNEKPAYESSNRSIYLRTQKFINSKSFSSWISP